MDRTLTVRQMVAAPRVIASVLLLAAGCGRTATVAPAAPAAGAAASHARALAITGRMLETYRKADSYSDHATYVEESVLRGEGVARELPYFQLSLAFKRTNQIRLTLAEAVADATGQRRGFDVACDGEFLRAAMPEIPDQTVENPAPRELTADAVLGDPLIHEKLFQRALGDVFPQLAMLLNTNDDDASDLFANDSNPRLLANERLDGRNCYRVATSHPEGTRVLWIDAQTYELRRMELPVDAHRERIDPDGNYVRLSVRIDFEEVTFDAVIDSESFALAPPPGARRVRRFVLPEEDFTGAGAIDGSKAINHNDTTGTTTDEQTEALNAGQEE